MDLVSKLHEEAVLLLASPGFKCHNAEVESIFLRTGKAYRVELDGQVRISVEPELVETALETTPRRGEFIARYGVPNHSFGGGGTATLVREKGEVRLPTLTDVENIMKVAESHNIPFMFRGVGPRHTPSEDVAQIAVMRKHYSGYIYVYVGSMEGIEAVHSEHKRDPRIATCHSHFYSPLKLNDNGPNVPIFIEACKRNLPIFLTVMPISYSTGPASIYGLALQAHAECLCGLVMAQILQPGITTIPSAFPLFADPLTDYRISFGSIYHQMVNLLCAKVYHYLDLPSNHDGCSAGHSEGDDTAGDVYRAYKIWNGQDYWHQVRHCFGFSEEQMVYSIAQMKRDLSMLRVVLEDGDTYAIPEFQYDPEAYDTIWDVCFGGFDNYMYNSHTLKHSRPVR